MTESTSVDGGLELSRILSKMQAFVTYIPLRGEVPFLDYITLPEGTAIYQISPRASLDPKAEAAAAKEKFKNLSVTILIPGRTFDATGTRHGRGGGWYDRFLAEVPREWTRIGFCYESQFSREPLVRQEWDQAMDVVCVIDGGVLRVHQV